MATTTTDIEKKSVVCVFCGSSPGTSKAHMAAAEALAQTLHAHNFNLVYGGGTVGLMGQLARTLVSLSGPSSVHGIIPDALIKYEAGLKEGTTSTEKENYVSETAVSKEFGRTTIVPDMHSRKALMAKKVREGGPGSGFVALSGGFGTMEELMEVTTWNQLGIHSLPVVVYNVEGYWDGLMAWIVKAVESGFIKENCKGIVQEAKDEEGVVKALREYEISQGRLNLQWGKE
ncbi:MAG: hypothetical protein M1831_001866 [Alyxoria varia]|nr:MAG: hypothetical protein M1831_001866 [Alyxoria varia]